ncbi:MAG: sigma-70 family RNA polymerase sigma factor [Planctomycetota bacterium]
MGAPVLEPSGGQSASSPQSAQGLRLTRVASDPPGQSGVGTSGGDAGPEDVTATVAAAAKGDQAAWARLVSAYSPRVFAMVRSRVRDPELSEEITQSVFATVARQLGNNDGYREQGRFEAWLFRVALNRVRDEARRRKRRSALQERISVDPLVAGSSVQDVQRADTDQLSGLREALGKLGERDRDIIELRHHAQMSFKQIAESLGEPVGTLLARHHRALRKLRDMIGSDESEASE